MNIMIDLETVGIRPTSGILSIGAVTFSEEGIALGEFYRKIDLSDSTLLGFTTDSSTMTWWNNQPPSVKDEAFSGVDGVRDVLNEFAAFVKQFYAPKVWGNGADFDNVLLKHHYDVMNLKCPWAFTSNRCFRTLKNLYPMIAFEKSTMPHNALEDAKAQAAQRAKF